MKLFRQIASILAVVLFYAVTIFFIYRYGTSRLISDHSDSVKIKSVELGAYLPFDDSSKVARLDGGVSELLRFDADEAPVIDCAAALYPVISSYVAATYPEETVDYDGSFFTEGSRLQMNNTRDAYKRIVDGRDDVILVASASEEQMAYAKEQGVELVFTPVGKEAFVFIVAGDNPVDSLTVDEIKGIYTNKYFNWAQLGGKDELIAHFERNNGSGSQTAFLKFMGDTEYIGDYDAYMGSPIGFSYRFYVSDIMGAGSVKLLAINGIEPNTINIANDTYPITGNILAVYRSDASEETKELVEWMLTDEGQELLEKSGYVSLN